MNEGKSLLQAVGINLNQRVLYEGYVKIFEKVDEDGSKNMDFAKFLLMMRELLEMNFGGIADRFH